MPDPRISEMEERIKELERKLADTVLEEVALTDEERRPAKRIVEL